MEQNYFLGSWFKFILFLRPHYWDILIIDQQNMKDKFTIFSPPAAKVDSFETSVNFKKSPNEFPVYESLGRGKDGNKFPSNFPVPPSNLDNLKKLPSEYSTLRQTLSYKPSNFSEWMKDDDDNKGQKASTNILRQTMNTKSSFRPKLEKPYSQPVGMQQSQSTSDLYQKSPPQPQMSYPRKGTNGVDIKSLRSIEYQNSSPTLEQLREKWSSGGFKVPTIQTRKQKLGEQVDKDRITSGSRARGDEDEERTKANGEKKYSYQKEEQEDQNMFRKKTKAEEPLQCYTPKLPKYSYDERFKKVGSPTSTNNSDSRSPPNRFLEFEDPKKKPLKLSFQDFVIGKTLGEGKFGVVMMARHKKSGFLVALKKIPKEMIKSHFMIDQLALEIRLQSCLNQKNILGIYGFFDSYTHLFIVLEYMEQGTLYAQLKKNRILAEKEAATIIKQMSQAVEYLHDHDIAHRDIKPQNIVISNNVCKLCDFGWATLCNERRKTYCGTFDYAAPEILEGKEYDMSVDLWCLGVLTFQLLAGKAPFYHLSRKQTMRKIINCEQEAVTYPETMSTEAVDFIEKLIRKNPEERMKAGEALRHKFLAQIGD